MGLKLRSPRPEQRGVALLTAMFVVFLATFASVELVYSLQLAINRSAVVLSQRQAWFYAIGGESWARAVLQRDQEADREQNLARDWRGEEWGAKAIQAPIAGASVAGNIVDLQGRFNINNLVGDDGRPDPLQIDRFKRLLTLLEVKDLDVDAVTEAIVDWMDQDSETGPLGGAETSEYALKTPPYRAPNAPVADVSELWLVQGVDRNLMAALQNEICALPPGTPLNVNTASWRVLMSLSPDIDRATAERLVPDPENNPNPFNDPQEFAQELQLEDAESQSPSLAVSSSFFEVNVQVATAFGETNLRSVLQRLQEGSPRVISRGLGQPQ